MQSFAYVPLFFRISESRNFMSALSMALLFGLAAHKNNFMFEAMRVSILLFLAALDSLGMERVQSVTWVTTVSAHTKIIRNITLGPQLWLCLFMV